MTSKTRNMITYNTCYSNIFNTSTDPLRHPQPTQVHRSWASLPLSPYERTAETWSDRVMPGGWWCPGPRQHWWCKSSSWPAAAPRCCHTAFSVDWTSCGLALGPGCDTPGPSWPLSEIWVPSGWLKKNKHMILISLKQYQCWKISSFKSSLTKLFCWMCWQSSTFSSVWVPINSSSVLLTAPLCSPGDIHYVYQKFFTQLGSVLLLEMVTVN